MSKFTIGKATVNLIGCEREDKKPSDKAELLRIVRDLNVLEYPGIIEKKIENEGKSAYFYLYHLSDIRGNIVRWLPVKKYEKVLEVDAECGAITAALVKISGNVTAIASDATDAEILAERFSSYENFTVYGGEIGTVLNALQGRGTGAEFGANLTEKPEVNSTVNPTAKSYYEWIIVRNPNYLDAVKPLLAPNGRVVFITDNRMGMKNLAGEKAYGAEDYFTGIEGKDNAGFTFAGLRKLFAVTGYPKAQMYYPYPDYRFMKSLFSNNRLPKTGELVDNLRNLNSDRLMLFSEKEAFDACCEDGSFQYYSNSYLTVLGEPLNIEYARFSNDRAPEYAIFTTIENQFGDKKVKKQPLTDAANDHIRNISKYYKKLCDRYSGSLLNINKCNLMDFDEHLSADFEYVNGVELSKLMDTALQRDDLDLFYKLFDKYVSLLSYNENSDIADIDVVFSNILVDKENWTLIDYEWCKEGKLPVKETAYRAIYCYLLEDSSRNKFNRDIILDKLVLSTEAAEEIENDEMSFQKRVTGRNLSLSELRERLGFKAVDPTKMAETIRDESGFYKFQIYPGGKTGEFSEETSYIYKDAYKSDNLAEATANVAVEDSIMRIDPLDSTCIVIVREAKLGELDFPIENKKYLFSNGKRVGDNTFVFPTTDPNLYFNLDGFIHDEDTFLYVKLEIIPIPEDLAKNISDNIKKFF